MNIAQIIENNPDDVEILCCAAWSSSDEKQEKVTYKKGRVVFFFLQRLQQIKYIYLENWVLDNIITKRQFIV